jgi:hypothetical protein
MSLTEDGGIFKPYENAARICKYGSVLVERWMKAEQGENV